MIRPVLGSRASIGGPLGSGRGGAAAWYLAGGVSAANCVAAYQPIGAASLAASYTNLANPGTNNAAPGVAPTFDTATGWTFALARGQYLLSGLTVATDQSWSIIVRFSDALANFPICGSNNGAGARFAIWPNNTAGVAYQYGGQLDVAPAITNGILAIAGNKGYRNGSADSGTIAGWTGGTAGYQIAIGARNGSPITPGDCKIQALAIYNVTLTAPQVAAVSAAMSLL